MLSYILLGLVVATAGFIDSLAGGGGILTLPAYLIFGVPPALVLGTNKLASSIGTVIAAYKFRKSITVSKKLVWRLTVLSLSFSALGAGLSRLVPADKLKFIILIIIPVMVYFILSDKKLGRVETRQKIGIKKSNRAAKKITSAVACYDGFLGPGAGTMFAVFLTKYAGFEIMQSTAITKILNLASNVFALLVFICVGAVNYKLGLLMGCFSILGQSLGVYVGKRRGANIIRPMILIVSFIIFIKFSYDIFFGG